MLVHRRHPRHCTPCLCDSARLGLLESDGPGTLSCWHLPVRKPSGASNELKFFTFFYWVNGDSLDTCHGFTQCLPFRNLADAIVTPWMQVSAVHDQPPSEPQGTVGQWADLLQAYLLCFWCYGHWTILAAFNQINSGSN